MVQDIAHKAALVSDALYAELSLKTSPQGEPCERAFV